MRKESKDYANFLSADDKKRIADAIAEAEENTIGQIKVVVVESSRKGLFRLLPRKQAVDRLADVEFEKLGMHRTKCRTGLLIFLSFKEGRVRIRADKGINKKVNAGYWKTIVDHIVASVQDGHPADGIISAVRVIGKRLEEHFPSAEGKVNELSDEVICKE